MDKNDGKKRSAAMHGRRVKKSEYDVVKKRSETEKKTEIRLLSEEEIRKKYRAQYRQKQLKEQRIRALLVTLCVIIVVSILVFMTPIFNIRSISVAGNQIVTLEEIDDRIGSLSGENLFRVSTETVRGRLSDLAYIDSITVTKRVFPPSIKVEITECRPAGYIKINGYDVVIDSSLKVLDDKNNLPTQSIPEITGLNSDNYKKGKVFETDSREKDDVLKLCLERMEETGIISGVNSIDLSNLTGIEFMYQNRIKVLCGSQIDLARKLALFRETVMSSNIDADAKGTIDLTVSGKAVFDR